MDASSAQREALLATARAMSTARLNVGTAGNASLRLGADGSYLITPTGLPPAACTPADLVVMTPDGTPHGVRAPSSEWRLHQDIYARRPEAGAIVHAHPPFATALACRRADIPPFHYMIARFGGATVRCAGYATFGTQALSDLALAALEERCACLLANHGMVVFGRDTAHALALAIEFEMLCEQYWRTLQLGEPALLSDAEMAEVIERFSWYGQPQDRR
ncbi:MAG TPA: class II aldolase/adducin family protein [Pseudothauera hydrothermalis]|jgi:L-fuculose-phosphate aldolase|nr:class II aldolase [Rhodocyclaceae bacterium]AVZ80228.1 class II aldolase [Zoogloeaceae bacteirum Par-f-2]HNQ75958.1 class II aldolase/adducin family protein [Pseudothauera hydrothermalis]